MAVHVWNVTIDALHQTSIAGSEIGKLIENANATISLVTLSISQRDLDCMAFHVINAKNFVTK
jgi:hypothetical protein